MHSIISGVQNVITILAIYTIFAFLLLYEMANYSMYLKNKKIVNCCNAVSILSSLIYLFGGISFLKQDNTMWIVVIFIILINSVRLFSINFFDFTNKT